MNKCYCKKKCFNLNYKLAKKVEIYVIKKYLRFRKKNGIN